MITAAGIEPLLPLYDVKKECLFGQVTRTGDKGTGLLSPRKDSFSSLLFLQAGHRR